MRTRSIGTAVALLLWCYPAIAAIRPAFSLDYSAFHATDIVMVRTTRDSALFEVVESWKGNLPAGEKLLIPELRPLPSAAPISAYYHSQSPSNDVDREAIPKLPPGSSMILFLRSAKSPPDSSSGRRWLPSDLMSSMKASAVWIEENQTYCFTQMFNPGPSVLEVSAHPLQQMRDRVAQIVGIQQDLTTVLALPDVRLRAEALRPYTYSNIFPVEQFAVEQLGNSGPAAVPTILGLVDDPTVPCDASQLVEILMKAGGSGVGPDMATRLSQELVFWKSAASSLHQGWWNADPTIHAPLRQHYGKTLQLVVGLRQIGFAPALATLVQLRDFWRSQPQLNDSTGLDQMAEECDRTVSSLRTN